MQAVVLALLALALSGILPALGPWLHSLGLFAGLTWLGWTLWQRRGAWRCGTANSRSRPQQIQMAVCCTQTLAH